MADATVLDAKAGVGSQGLDEAPEATFDKVAIAGPVEQPKTRNVTLIVPADLPDAAIKAAWQIGISSLKQMDNSLMVCLFPSSQKGPDGTTEAAVGNFAVLLAKEDDVKRMMTLGQVITQVNQRVMLAKQSSPSAELIAKVEGNKAKDNASADLAAQAQGRKGGIVIAGR